MMLGQKVFALRLELFGLPVKGESYVRIKIEHGIVFLKPVYDIGEPRRSGDLLKIIARRRTSAVCLLIGGLWVNRVTAFIEAQGWSSEMQIFTLHGGGRGWFAISEKARKQRKRQSVAVGIAPIHALNELTDKEQIITDVWPQKQPATSFRQTGFQS